MQTSLTELLERIDVLNDRIAKLGVPADAFALREKVPAGAVQARPQRRRQSSEPQRRARTAEAPAPAPVADSGNRALRGAQLADDYRNALMLYGKGRSGRCARRLPAIFDAEPGGELADNALYWIGETYFAAGDYANAMRFYGRVTKEFRDQNKAPDAMFKIGLAFEKTGDLGMARTDLRRERSNAIRTRPRPRPPDSS